MANRNNIFGEPPVSIMIDKPQLDCLISELPQYAHDKWVYRSGLIFEYDDFARVTIPYTQDSWRCGYLQFGTSSTIQPVKKEYLFQEEITQILNIFFEDIIDPYLHDHKDIKVLREGKQYEVLHN